MLNYTKFEKTFYFTNYDDFISEFIATCIITGTTVSYEESGVSSNKKRKLTFDKDFMLAGGQTRLKFM